MAPISSPPITITVRYMRYFGGLAVVVELGGRRIAGA